jgi:hypothetical protein
MYIYIMALPHNLPAQFPPGPLPEAGAGADHEPNPAAALLLAGARPGNDAHFGPNNEFLPSSNEVVDRQFYNSLNRVRLLGDRANALIGQSYNFRRRLMDKIQRMRQLVYFMRAIVTNIRTALEHGGNGAGDAAAAACRAEIADALAAERRGVIDALDPLSETLLRSLVELLQHPGLDVDDILAALQDAIAAWNTEVHRLVAILPANQQNAPPAPPAPPGDGGMSAQWTAAGGPNPPGQQPGPLPAQAPDIRGDDEMHGNIGAAEAATRAPYPYGAPPAAGDANYAYQQGPVLPRQPAAARRAQFRAQMAARAAAAPGTPPPPGAGVPHAGPPAPAAGGQGGGWTPTGVRKRKSHRKRHGKKGKKHKTRHKKKKRHKKRRKTRYRRRRTKHRR